VSGEFVARMEDVLELYATPLDAARPVVCVDELSKELHGQVAEPVPPGPGRPVKEDYEYRRNGTANVLLLLCPLLGWRHLAVTARRGYLEFAQLMKALVDVHFPTAEVIRVVLDNLNTHVLGALYEAFAPADALDGGASGAGGGDDLPVGPPLVGQQQDLDAAALPACQGVALQPAGQVGPLGLRQSNEGGLAHDAPPGGWR